MNVNNFYKNARMEHTAEVFRAFVDNSSFIYEHQSPIVDTTSFVVSLAPMRGVIENFLVIREISEDLTVDPTMDTYFYLSGDSTILRRAVFSAAPAPATPSGSHPLYKVESDGAGVTGVTNLYTPNALNPVPLGNDSVDTINLVDGSVTSVKLADITVGATVGHPSLVLIRNNDKGQVDLLQSNMSLGGLSNGQILVYNSGLNRFENADNTAVNTIGYIPKVDAGGTNYADSSILELGTEVVVEKQLEINDGAVEGDSYAKLNVVGGPILAPRMKAGDAGLLPLNDGYFVYVIDTDATFTSVGFWGVENNTWIKL
jgi:hypothetical protein